MANEYNVDPMRVIFLPMKLQAKLKFHPMGRSNEQIVDLILTGDRYVPSVPVFNRRLVMLSPKSFDIFGAHEIIGVEVLRD